MKLPSLIVLLAAIVALPASAAASRARWLIDADQLATSLDKPHQVILHVGDATVYEAGHLPGARLLTPGMFQRPRGNDPEALLLELPDPKALQAQMQQLGIAQDSHVVVVFGKDEFAPATRVIYTLDAAGWGGQAALLDGGQPE
ncbi:MAG: rhodanese-like domain-containing protein, partial [Steroidobacteraceae bacterium]